jgi:lysosomal Pro-X carboxypeptidase
MDTFNLCTIPTTAADVESLIGFINGCFGTEAMVNYPYATDFVGSLPANPVAESCTQAATVTLSTDQDYVLAIQKAAEVFYNWQGASPGCILDPSPASSNALDDDGWDVLYCNEMIMPFAQSGVTDMFLPEEWNEEAEKAYCFAAYGEMPQFNWALDFYGGRNPKRDFAHVSNIIFSNGDLDPWHVGGIMYDVGPGDQSVHIYIMQSAHHLDLREPNAADP